MTGLDWARLKVILLVRDDLPRVDSVRPLSFDFHIMPSDLWVISHILEVCVLVPFDRKCGLSSLAGNEPDERMVGVLHRFTRVGPTQ